jgi:hypothetical protein
MNPEQEKATRDSDQGAQAVVPEVRSETEATMWQRAYAAALGGSIARGVHSAVRAGEIAASCADSAIAAWRERDGDWLDRERIHQRR